MRAVDTQRLRVSQLHYSQESPGRHCVEHLYVFEDFSSGFIFLTGNRFSEICERLRLIKRLVAWARCRFVLGLTVSEL